MSANKIDQEIKDWITQVTGEQINHATDNLSLQEILKDGSLLCRTLNCAFPQYLRVKYTVSSTMPFRQMENIAAFNAGVLTLPGFRTFDAFTTVDLFEGKNMEQVRRCLLTCKRLHQKEEKNTKQQQIIDEPAVSGKGFTLHDNERDVPGNEFDTFNQSHETGDPIPQRGCDDELIEPEVELVESPVEEKSPFHEDEDLGTFTIEVA